MAMDTDGMAMMADMAMPLPFNTLPMMTGTGPFGPIEMSGMFTIMKVRGACAWRSSMGCGLSSRARSLGFPITQIDELLDFWRDKRHPSRKVRTGTSRSKRFSGLARAASLAFSEASQCQSASGAISRAAA